MAPIAKGLGYGMLFISFLVVIYYNLIIAWTIYYTFAGFTSELPWTNCGEGVNATLTSRDCYYKIQEQKCFNESDTDTFWNRGCTSVDEVCRQFNFTLSDQRENGTGILMCKNATGFSHKLNSVLNRLDKNLRTRLKQQFMITGVQESVT